MSAPDITSNAIPYIGYHRYQCKQLNDIGNYPLMQPRQSRMDRLRAEEFYHCKPYSAENLQPTVSVTNRLSSWQALGDLSETGVSDDENDTDNDSGDFTNKRDTVVKVTFHVENFQPRDIRVSICDDVLHVDAAAHSSSPEEEEGEVRRLFRRVRIPNEVDAEKITTRWTTDGTLTIEVPIIQQKIMS